MDTGVVEGMGEVAVLSEAFTEGEFFLLGVIQEEFCVVTGFAENFGFYVFGEGDHRGCAMNRVLPWASFTSWVVGSTVSPGWA